MLFSFSSNPNVKDKRRVAQKRNVIEIVFALSNSKVRATYHYWNDGNPVCETLPGRNSAFSLKKTKEASFPP